MLIWPSLGFIQIVNMLKCFLLDGAHPHATTMHNCDMPTRIRLQWPIPYEDLRQLVPSKGTNASSSDAGGSRGGGVVCQPEMHGYPWGQHSPFISVSCPNTRDDVDSSECTAV